MKKIRLVIEILKISINKILNTINFVINVFPKQYIYIYIITLWITLWILDFVTETRLIRFCIVLLIIACYKILHQQVSKINIKDEHIPILLKIYKYKNPIILLIIKLELKISYFIYNLSKKNIKLIYLNLIYNLTALNGIKIVLTKFYKILINWKKYTIYEIIFKRIYGMILSIIIFTNIIQLMLNVLNTITTNWLIWIYIFLIIISYAINISSIDTIEYLRKESNLIWLLLKKKKIETQDQDLKTLLGLLNVKNMLNYENYFEYLLLSWEENIKINYHKPSYMYCYEIQNILFDTTYIFDLKAKLKKINKNKNDIDLINICEYHLLIYKLSIFYIWDLEKALEIKETLIQIIKETPDWLDERIFIYDYNIKEFKKIYYEKIQNIQLNKFWDLIENHDFYEKMHSYLYNKNLKNIANYKTLLEIKNEYDWCDKYLQDEENVNNINTEEYDTERLKQLEKQLKEWRQEWELQHNFNLQEKYYNIFNYLEILQNKINI